MAYSLESNFPLTKKKTDKLFIEIEKILINKNVKSFVHISTIILNQKIFKNKSNITKNSIYEYSKSYSEYLVHKINKRVKIPTYILRSGNIMGPGSTWAVKICKRISDGLPILGPDFNSYFSNSTYVGNLIYCIHSLSMSQNKVDEVSVMNFSEFGHIEWKSYIEFVGNIMESSPIYWKNDISFFHMSLASDILKSFKKALKIFIPSVYKGVIANNFIVKTYSFFNKEISTVKTKKTIKNNLNIDDIDLAEFSLMSVFMSKTKTGLENVPKEISENLPFNFESSLKSLNQWIYFSGFNKL